MTGPVKSELELRLARLEKRLSRTQAGFVAALIILVASLLYFAIHSSSSRSGGILRVQGLIVEDTGGHERILIGAPVPAVNGRQRRDDTVGIVVLGENGADRVAIGAPVPDPQIQGKSAERIGKGAGLVFDDTNGDERGGLGIVDNDGRAILGLDYPHGKGEAITLGVFPGEASLAIHDSKTFVRAGLLERNDAPPILYGVESPDPSKIDMGILRLNPYLVRHVVTKASDEAFNKALDDMGH